MSDDMKTCGAVSLRGVECDLDPGHGGRHRGWGFSGRVDFVAERAPSPPAAPTRGPLECEHGSLARKCLVCELTAALASERAAREQAERERDALKARANASEALLTEARAWGEEQRRQASAHYERAEAAEAERDALRAERDEVRKSAASEAAAMCERYADRAWKAENECVALRADLARTRGAITKLADEWEAKADELGGLLGRGDTDDMVERDTLRACAESLRALSPSDTGSER